MINKRFPYFKLLIPAVMAMVLITPASAQIVAFGASNVSGWNVAASEAFPA